MKCKSFFAVVAACLTSIRCILLVSHIKPINLFNVSMFETSEPFVYPEKEEEDDSGDFKNQL